MRKVSAAKTSTLKIPPKRAPRAKPIKSGSASRRGNKPTAAAAAPTVRERILEVAERLFAEHGMSGVGLRAIVDTGGRPVLNRLGRRPRGSKQAADYEKFPHGEIRGEGRR